MTKKSSAYYQREFRRRMREQGLVKKEVWILPENATYLSEAEKALRVAETFDVRLGGRNMIEVTKSYWNTSSLHEAIKDTSLVLSGQAELELIDGIDSSLCIVMTEFGDLPIYLTVSGEQVIVESILWPVADVTNQAKFNEIVLKTHKYFPLSTISIDRSTEGVDYYHMFCALSAASSLDDVVFEVEVLAGNVIQATEAFSEFLKMPKQA